MRRSNKSGRLLLVFLDILAFILAFLISYWIRMKSGYFTLGYVPLQDYVPVIILSCLFVALLFASFSLYQIKRLSSFIDEFLTVAKALFLLFLMLTAASFAFKVTMLSRIIIFLTFFFSLFFISTGRFLLLKKILCRQKSSCVIYTKNELGIKVHKKIKEHAELGYSFLGFITKLSDIRKYRPETVFVTTHVNPQELAMLSARYPDVEFKVVPSYTELIMEPLSLFELQDIPLITLHPESTYRSYVTFKRLFDAVLSFFLLLILSPLFLAVALFIKASSPGPVFYTQQRVGKHGLLFDCYKFRTMRGDEKIRPRSESGYLFKVAHDPRITLIGRLLRRFCLDELPQLFNVLKGDMSLVGPRPHLQDELKRLKDWQKRRFSVLPGMTGLWQISGRHELSFEKSMLLDIYYIKNMSFKLDLAVILKTVPAILFSKMG